MIHSECIDLILEDYFGTAVLGRSFQMSCQRSFTRSLQEEELQEVRNFVADLPSNGLAFTALRKDGVVLGNKPPVQLFSIDKKAEELLRLTDDNENPNARHFHKMAISANKSN